MNADCKDEGEESVSVYSSEGTRFGLSGNALKLIAIIAMTVDHLAWMGIETYSHAETPLLIFLHVIGRLTAPIMLFFVAEGYSHTHNFRKYLGRMAQLYIAGSN